MTSADLKNKTRSGYKLRANCPGCCPDTQGRATFHQGWDNDNDPNADEIGAAVWSCGNCGFEVSRRVRMSPAEAAYRRMKRLDAAAHDSEVA
jgi:C4-type Zn-finger protein